MVTQNGLKGEELFAFWSSGKDFRVFINKITKSVSHGLGIKCY